ncbi:response regulator [Mesonia sediminis]|uniref:Response regulator n=1 Tax=Mesonia sediminis TaxID=1703946 RepID=A0ABW5SAK1_9FLAO
MRKVNVLLVEDNEGDILLTQEAFEESKVQADLSVVRNGQEALDFLFKRKDYEDAQRPDIILLDINIPIYNGHEVLQQIKTDEQLKTIPVIMLTTSNNQEDVKKCYEQHCNTYIVKPLDMEEFLEVILKIDQFWLQLSVIPD